MPEATRTIDPQTIDHVRGRTLEFLDRLSAKTAELELPQPPDVLQVYRCKLQENRYTVLVAGEAKRGKSSFINAILGRSILPTDVDVATCQVFCIRQAPSESYRVRFEDDSVQEIMAADLPLFGSQVLMDSPDTPECDRNIRWIEIEGPMPYMPKEITLLDTPGLGSLYAEHGRIIQRFVPLADAVIFVLNSDSPIGREELHFLEQILGVTRSVFFIQTMIDRYQRDHWQAILNRNEQILAEKIGNRLADRQVWPISSVNLLKAAQSGDADYEAVSKFRPLASALQSFLFRAAGWNRTAEALLLAGTYQKETAQILTARLKGLDSTALERTSLLQQLAKRATEFEQQYGQAGYKRQELLAGIRQFAVEGKWQFRQALQPGCKIEVELHNKIDTIASLDQTNQFAALLSSQVKEEATLQWNQVVGRFQRRCIEQIREFVEAGEPASESPCPESEVAFRTGLGLNEDEDPLSKIMVSASHFVESTTLLGSAAFVMSLFIATSWFPPLAITSVLAAGVWAAVRGWRDTGRAQLQDARESLHVYLDEVIFQVRRHFFDIGPTAGDLNRTDHYFDSHVDLLTERIGAYFRRKLAEIQTEIDRRNEEIALDEVQRKQKAETLARQIETWNLLGTDITDLAKELNNLERIQSGSVFASELATEQR